MAATAVRGAYEKRNAVKAGGKEHEAAVTDLNPNLEGGSGGFMLLRKPIHGTHPADFLKLFGTRPILTTRNCRGRPIPGVSPA